MAYYQGSTLSHRAQRESFEYLADFSHVAEWDPSVRSAKRLDTGPLQVGSAFLVELTFLGNPLSLEYHVLAYDPPHAIQLRAESESFCSTDSIFVQARGEQQSLVTYDAQIQLFGAWKWLNPLVHVAFTFAGRKAMHGLHQVLSR